MTEQKLRELLQDMSLAEKFGQLEQMAGQFYSDDCIETGVNAAFDFTEEEAAYIGSALNVWKPERIIELQKNHMARHPHGIPMLFMLDIIHGYSTIYPIPLAQACSFDPDLVRTLARATARESCAAGQHVTFSPMVDLCRDARWGRVMEGSGEDPYLNCKMAEAAVQGYQGDDLAAEGSICACVKHFAAYGAGEGGREYGYVDVSERMLRQYYLPAYKAACDAGSAMLMTAFNAISGVPASGSRALNAILREEWGFDGTVISDYSSVTNMYSHGVAPDSAEATRRALEGGVDIEMCINQFRRGLPQLVESGVITEEQIDRAVWRVLSLKNKLGLFENPYHFASPEKAAELQNCEEFLNLARASVPRCSVLLKNDEQLLPLSPDSGEKVAFIGPFLDDGRILGGWVNGNLDRIPTAAMQEVLQARFPNRAFTYTKGCALLGVEDVVMAKKKGAEYEDDQARRRAMLQEAVAAAQNADTVVLFLGEHPNCGGELASRADIRLAKTQRDLFEAVWAVNQNIVTVVFDHRPVELGVIAEKSKALLNVWFPGTMGAEGITDMLFGDAAPTGRTTMSFPICTGQEPIYYNRLPTDHGEEFHPVYVTGYIDCPLDPLYCFGEGLTYTDFAYGEVRLDRNVLRAGETLTAAVTVKNVGARDGEETVQLYIRDSFASVSQPIKELKGFTRVCIPAGESVDVTFTLTPDDLRFYNEDLEFVWEAGEIQVFIGHDSRVSEYKTFCLEK